MGIEQFEIVETNFNLKYISTYELSILLGMDSFAYMVSNASKEVLALGQLPFNPDNVSTDTLANILSTFVLLQHNYKTTQVVYGSDTYSLIPERLHNQNHQSALLSHLVEESSLDLVQSDKINDLPIYNVYNSNSVIMNWISKYFKEAKVRELNSLLIPIFSKKAKAIASPMLFILTYQQTVRLFYFEDGNVLLVNSFEYHSPQDLLYYTLLPVQQFNHKQQEVHLYLLGNIDEHDEVTKLLSQYFETMNFLRLPSYVILGPKLMQQAAHLHYDIYAILIS